MFGKILGHTQIQTTAPYAHLAREMVVMSVTRIGDIRNGPRRLCWQHHAGVVRDTHAKIMAQVSIEVLDGVSFFAAGNPESPVTRASLLFQPGKRVDRLQSVGSR